MTVRLKFEKTECCALLMGFIGNENKKELEKIYDEEIGFKKVNVLFDVLINCTYLFCRETGQTTQKIYLIVAEAEIEKLKNAGDFVCRRCQNTKEKHIAALQNIRKQINL